MKKAVAELWLEIWPVLCDKGPCTVDELAYLCGRKPPLVAKILLFARNAEWVSSIARAGEEPRWSLRRKPNTPRSGFKG